MSVMSLFSFVCCYYRKLDLIKIDKMYVIHVAGNAINGMRIIVLSFWDK